MKLGALGGPLGILTQALLFVACRKHAIGNLSFQWLSFLSEVALPVAPVQLISRMPKL